MKQITILLTNFDQLLQGLSTSSPSFSCRFFFHFLPKQRACSQARIYYANRTTAGEVFELDITVPDKLYGRLHISDRISQSPD